MKFRSMLLAVVMACAAVIGIAGTFLVAQTDVTGIWARDRRHRICVYLAGMTCDLTLGAAAVLVHYASDPAGLVHRLAAVVAITAGTALLLQFLVFMRTDVYFLMQDLSGCRNLYADGSAYFWWRLRNRRRPDPSRNLAVRERRTVRWYALLLGIGTPACIAFFAATTLPAHITVAVGSVRRIADPPDLPAVVDGVAAIAFHCLIHGAWVFAWWRRHGSRVRRWAGGVSRSSR